MFDDPPKRSSCCVRETIRFVQTERIEIPSRQGLRKNCPSPLFAALLLYGVSACPPLQIRIIESVPIIVSAAFETHFFAGKAVKVGIGEWADHGKNVSEWIVKIPCHDALVNVDQASWHG